MQAFDVEYTFRPDPYDNWVTTTHLLADLETGLAREYGQDVLLAYGDDEQRGPSDLANFILRGWPWEVLDAVEHFFSVVAQNDEGDSAGFQREIKTVLAEETRPMES